MEQKKSLKVMTFNIHHGKGIDNKLDLERQAEVLRNSEADIVLLQEVDCGTRRCLGVNQVKFISEKSGFDYSEFGKNIDFDSGEYGNAILSRYPIVFSENHKLPKFFGVRNESRGLLHARVEVEDVFSNILCTHFGLTIGERIKSSRFILDLIEKLEEPIILGGDLNAWISITKLINREYGNCGFSKEIYLLEQKFKNTYEHLPRGENSTYPSDNPKFCLDYIFFKGDINVNNAKVVNTDVSDHRPLLVDFKL